MMAEKTRFDVFCREVIAEPGEEMQIGPWEFIGSTWAVSEKRAVNNVKFRIRGSGKSQFFALPCDSAVYEQWKAEKSKNHYF